MCVCVCVCGKGDTGLASSAFRRQNEERGPVSFALMCVCTRLDCAARGRVCN